MWKGGHCVSYKVNEDGTEHMVRFALEGQFMTDLYSFLTDEPSVYNIDAIEDSELVLITKSASDELRKQSSKYLEYIFNATSEAYIDLERRLTSTISHSLEERYKDLVAHYGCHSTGPTAHGRLLYGTYS